MDHRIMGNILYLNEKQNIICWKKSHFVRMADELDIYRLTVLEGNPSLLAKLAFWALDNGRKLYRPDVITFTYELPSFIHNHDRKDKRKKAIFPGFSRFDVPNGTFSGTKLQSSQ